MSNTVYGVSVSPFVRKVLMALDHKVIPYTLVNAVPHDTSPAFRRASPLGKVPAFEDEHGTLADSSVIVQYLESRYPETPLLPAEPMARARVLWLEEFADSALVAPLGTLFFERGVKRLMGQGEADEGKIASAMESLPALLDYLESQVPEQGFLAGDGVTLADLSVPSVFLNARYVGYQVDAGRWPRLQAYLERLWAHPLYQARIADERDMAGMLAA